MDWRQSAAGGGDPTRTAATTLTRRVVAMKTKTACSYGRAARQRFGFNQQQRAIQYEVNGITADARRR
jgi:hypothetical protein